jgi:glutamate-1-semialdehyde aminotransferase
MSEWNTEELIAADKRLIWHPFTDMREWCSREHEPLILVEGRGALLRDSRGREYIDGNSSIWTNIHGHNHPHINRGHPAPTRPGGAHLVFGLHEPGGRRARAPDRGTFPRELVRQSFFL